MYRLYQQIDYSQRISRRIFVYFIPFCSTNRQLVVGEVALEVHSVQSDHDSTALSDVILPHPHVLLSQTAIKKELVVIICVFTGYLSMIVQRRKITKPQFDKKIRISLHPVSCTSKQSTFGLPSHQTHHLVQYICTLKINRYSIGQKYQIAQSQNIKHNT